MKIGVVFPQNEVGPDPAVLKDFAQTAEALGYHHLIVYDHVLGADRDRNAGWTGYDKDDQFHEPFVLFGYLAGLTKAIEFVTSVLILPQRQTALVAKQAAEVNVLSGGRLRLGVGTGWNPVEYEALNENFHNRGRRQEEQVDLLRKLWSNEVVDYTGKWHRVDRAGLNPMPVSPIPIWFGGNHENVLKRAARIGDGWMPLAAPGADLGGMLGRLDDYLAAAGRDRSSFGIEGILNLVDDSEKASRQVEGWRTLGATHAALRTLRSGLESPRAHIEAIRRYAEGLGELFKA